MVRRRGDVHQELCAAKREIRRRRAGLPHVFANSRTDQRLSELEQDEIASRCEVTVFVEDAVVRKEALAIDRFHFPARADGACVEEIAIEVRRPDERSDTAARSGDLVELPFGGANKPGPQEEVLGRIAGDDQLREEDDVHAVPFRLVDALDDALRVTVEVADDGVDLGEPESHAFSLRL